jgi:DNA polymerase-3 subunit gamma/tau
VAEERQHQALYRRYRPQAPAEVLGQDHVIRALTGAVREGKLAHAFLFCGPRGTGKTSTARILAKMVNCERGPTPEPCDACEQCVAIREGQHLDVVEIDAASHGGVDDARELRERAPTAPAMGREKVYIIDEAQRLSREAFDALLKVFEEPPPGVRFVLATTEPHRMPATIVGRCQRFDFRRVGAEQLAQHLLRVAEREGIALAREAASAIARQAEGSVRDALSLLDQASVLSDGAVDEATVAALLGAPRVAVRHEIADAIAVGDARAAFEVVARLVQDGHDLRHVTNELLGHFRDLLLVRAAPGQEDLLDVTGDEYERLRAQAAKFSPAELARILALLLQAQGDMRWTTSPRLSLELALVRAAIPEADPAPQGLLARIERLERLAGLGQGRPPEEAGRPAPAEPPAAEPAGGTAEPPAAPAGGTAEPPAAPAGPRAPDASGVDVAMLRRSWPSVLEHLQQRRQAILRALLESATVAAFDGATIELAFPPDRRFGVRKVEERAEELRRALHALFGISPEVRCVVRTRVEAEALDEEEPPPSEEEALRRLQEELGARPEA